MKLYIHRLDFKIISILFIVITVTGCNKESKLPPRVTTSFNNNWKFILSDSDSLFDSDIDDSNWRNLNLPHDWSIEGELSNDHPATVGGGALPGGIGWYRKTFIIPESDSLKKHFILFDGIYWGSKVYLNGHLLGYRPNGYISFQYDLSPYLNYGHKKNVLAVKVDNSNQPNSRWYSGSGIYRNVWLIKKEPVHIDLWGTYITTPEVYKKFSVVTVSTKVKNTTQDAVTVDVKIEIYDHENSLVADVSNKLSVNANSDNVIKQNLTVPSPKLWSVNNPYLYKVKTLIKNKGVLIDSDEVNAGIRNFRFDAEKGFFLNDVPLKILGVCNHHDLGCLGSAVNERAIERQLGILREMGCNAIRTSHNPPAPELLDLTDRMGFIVMDETFDMWKKPKTEYDYSQYWDDWHIKDLTDHILRDRNHPSVFIWSIGNEIIEQWDTSGTRMTKELVAIVKSLDKSRPITTANNYAEPENYILKSEEFELIGYNYKHDQFINFHEKFPGGKFIATETTSGLMTRGCYDMPSDSIRRWPYRWDKLFTDGNPDNTVSAYDNVSTSWGSTHAETWKIIRKFDFLSGMFIWTGFDYLGEPTPYVWPSRSSYFGIIDLAGIPKDVYYLYQSEWTDKPTLHVFPHWNWQEGQIIDVIAYTNCIEVELFLNGKSLGKKNKSEDDLKLMWRTEFIPGELKALGILPDGNKLETIVNTSGKPAKISLKADRNQIKANGKDLSFVIVEVCDSINNMVPYADNLINFRIDGDAIIAGVDNGDPVSHEPFKVNFRKAFHGKCLVVIQSKKTKNKVRLTASSKGLESAETTITIE
ncbi:MAG: DUF4982 domain-containing protein [Bacteroidales bacterium]|nr:DUF4982 domain-containing protein [Bacteroidales bacterium]